jgi:hypothetical protein
MKKRKRIKYLNPPMKFNVGLGKFEPDLDKIGRKTSSEGADRSSLIWLIAIIVLILILLLIAFI